MKLKIKVVPGASRTEVVGWYAVPQTMSRQDNTDSTTLSHTLKVRVAAPPERSKANKAVVQFMATSLNVPPAAIEIIHGQNASNKTLSVENVTLKDIVAVFGNPDGL